MPDRWEKADTIQNLPDGWYPVIMQCELHPYYGNVERRSVALWNNGYWIQDWPILFYLPVRLPDIPRSN
jgi:hypothetical protein